MAISLGQMILYSKDKKLLSSFLSQLLELETSVNDGDIILSSMYLSLRIVDFTSGNSDFRDEDLNYSGDLIIDFFVSSEDELKKTMQRVEFLNYCMKDLLKESSFELKSIGNTKFLEVIDPDNRKWRFTYRHPL